MLNSYEIGFSHSDHIDRRNCLPSKRSFNKSPDKGEDHQSYQYYKLVWLTETIKFSCLEFDKPRMQLNKKWSEERNTKIFNTNKESTYEEVFQFIKE